MNSNKKGQILLVTLLVLAILAIVVVGVVVLLNRDVEQVATNEKYQQIYNVSESQLQRIISTYADYSKPLSDIATDPGLQDIVESCPVSVQTIGEIEANCVINNTEILSSEVQTDIKITDSKKIDEFSLFKDDSLTLGLSSTIVPSGYRNRIDITWTGDMAIEFEVVYRNGSTYGNYKDVYDAHAVLDSFASGGSVSAGVLSITPDSNNPSNKVSVNLGTLPGGSNLEYLIITPRSKTEESTDISVEAADESAFPNQMRLFLSTSLDTGDESTPIVKVEAQVPLFPQLNSAFNYSLISNDLIEL
jgi:type II secretory pathway pseudopilin PulG